MTPADAARLLALAAAYDRRTVGEAEATAWADALDGLGTTECAEAIRSHYRESTAWLMPAHVRDRVKAKRKSLVGRHVDVSEIEVDADPDDVHAWLAALRAGRARAAAGDVKPRPVGDLIARTVKEIPA